MQKSLLMEHRQKRIIGGGGAESQHPSLGDLRGHPFPLTFDIPCFWCRMVIPLKAK